MVSMNIKITPLQLLRIAADSAGYSVDVEPYDGGKVTVSLHPLNSSGGGGLIQKTASAGNLGVVVRKLIDGLVSGWDGGVTMDWSSK